MSEVNEQFDSRIEKGHFTKDVCHLKAEIMAHMKAKNVKELQNDGAEGKHIAAWIRRCVNDTYDDITDKTFYSYLASSCVSMMQSVVELMDACFSSISDISGIVFTINSSLKNIKEEIENKNITEETFASCKSKMNFILDLIDDGFEKASKSTEIKIKNLNESFHEDYDMLDKNELMEFIESADYDDPEDLELVEEALEILQENDSELFEEKYKSYSDKMKQISRIRNKNIQLNLDKKDKIRSQFLKDDDMLKYCNEVSRANSHCMNREQEIEKKADAIKRAQSLKVGTAAVVAASGALIIGLKKLKSKCKDDDVISKADKLIAEAESLKKEADDLQKQASKTNDPKEKAKLEKKAEALAKKGDSIQAKADVLAKKHEMHTTVKECVEEAYMESAKKKERYDDEVVFDKNGKRIDNKGLNAKHVIAVGVVISGIAGLIQTAKKIQKSAENKQFEELLERKLNELYDLDDAAEELRKKLKDASNPISEKVIASRLKSIEAKYDKLCKEFSDMTVKIAKGTAKTESVNVDTKLSVYEATTDGILSKEDADFLLNILG